MRESPGILAQVFSVLAVSLYRLSVIMALVVVINWLWPAQVSGIASSIQAMRLGGSIDKAMVNFGQIKDYAFDFFQKPKLPYSQTALTEKIPQPVFQREFIADDGIQIPETGKFILVDKNSKKISFFNDGTEMENFPILTLGKSGMA